MNKKIAIIFLVSLIFVSLNVSFVAPKKLQVGVLLLTNSAAWSFERQTPSRISADQIAPYPGEGFEKLGNFCEIYNDLNNPEWGYSGFDSGTGFAVYMNPAQCGDFPYPFKLTDVHFYLYADDETYRWPVEIRVNIRDSYCVTGCCEPGDVLWSEDFSIPSDSAYPRMMTLSLSTPRCVNYPFFLEIVYTQPRDPAHPHPTLLMDAETPPADTCDNWAIWTAGAYYEWYDFWYPPPPGDAIIRATGYAGPTEPPHTPWWSRTYGGTSWDGGESVQQTTDGGYIVAGWTRSFGAGGPANNDVYLIKTDSLGHTQWTRTYGGVDDDEGRCVQQTTDGGYIVVGETYSFGDTSYPDVYLIKTNPNGDTLWSRTYGGGDYDYGRSVRQTTDGGYIVVGSTFSFGYGMNDVYLIKTNSNGDTLWTRTYGYSYNDFGYSVQQTTDGGYIVVGYTESFGVGAFDVYLIKTSSNGDILWSRTYGGGNYDIGYSVQQTTEGGYIVAGETDSFGESFGDVYLIKTNSSGGLLWSRIYGDTLGDLGYSVQQTTDGGYVVVGGTGLVPMKKGSSDVDGRDICLIKTNSSGGLQWSWTYGGSSWECGYSVQQTTDGGYIVAGYTESFGPGDPDVMLIKLDSEGKTCIGDSASITMQSVSSIVDTAYTETVFPVTVVSSPPTIMTSPPTQVTTVCKQSPPVADAGADQLDVIVNSLVTLDGACSYDPDGDQLSFYWDQISGTPVLLSNHNVVNPTFTPPVKDNYKFELVVDDEFFMSLPDTVLVSVPNHAPVLYCPTADTVMEGDTSQFRIYAWDVDGDSIILDALNIPLNAEFVDSGNGAGSFTFMPDFTQAGTYYVTFIASDGLLADSEVVEITVVEFGNHPPAIELPFSDTTIYEEDTLEFRISATDEDLDSIILDTLNVPANVVFVDSGNGAGSFTFTPDFTQADTYYVTFIASDGELADTKQCTITVLNVNQPPDLQLPFTDTTIYEKDTLEFRISATDQDEDAVILDTLNVPLNATFIDSGNGAGSFTFTPDFTQADTYYVTFIASDGELADTEQCTIIVLNLNRAPEIELPFSDTTIYEGDPLMFMVSATDPDEDSLYFYAYNLPEGAWFDPITMEFYWTPEYGQVGEYSMLFEVVDSPPSDSSLADSAYVTITVKNRILEVLTHYPTSNDSDVLIDDTISIALSEPINCQTVNLSTFKVESRRRGEILDSNYTCVGDSGWLRFSLPSDSMFPTLDTITVTVTIGILDLADSGMALDYSWEFYTGLGVYPGNTNNDTTVDERDILPLGFYWGETGPERKEEYKNTTWSIKPVHRWDPPLAVYADADGNGIVDEWDICAVADNWESKILSSPQNFQKNIEAFKEDHQKYLSIYEKIYNALLDCPESIGKNQIREFLEEILEKKNRPNKFEVFQNYPNPFNSMTVIKYSLPQNCQVEISLFNILGQKVKTLVNEYQTSGYQKVLWDGKNDQGEEVGSGIYFYQVEAQSFSCTRKLLFLK